jgi:Tfp pilus assembly protein PilV
MSSVPPAGKSRRRGYGMFEITISALLLVIAMGMMAEAVGWLATERRGAGRRQVALQEAANLMERLSARPWEDLTPDTARSLTLTRSSTSLLRDATLDVAITASAGDPSAKRITILIRWGDSSGNTAAPVRLVAWVHRHGSGREQ